MTGIRPVTVGPNQNARATQASNFVGGGGNRNLSNVYVHGVRPPPARAR